MMIKMWQMMALVFSCAAGVGCATASDSPASGDEPTVEWRLPEGTQSPESPISAARRIAAEPTTERREQLVSAYRTENPVPEAVSAARSSPPASHVGRTSQALVSACWQGIDGCVDWSNNACQIYAYCAVNTCSGAYFCQCDNVAAGGWGSCGF